MKLFNHYPFSSLRRLRSDDFIITPRKSAWLLFLISFSIGCLTIYWGADGDEADNLVNANLINGGLVLYRDIFSHHFPLPYYWTALVFLLFGKSILNARILLWLFQLVCFIIAMEMSSYYITLGCTALLWSVLRIYYEGNQVLYSSFCAPSILVIFCITLSVLQHKIKMNGKHSLAIGIFSVISLLCDPLSIYAIMISLFLLLTANPNKALKSIGYISVGFLFFALILVSTGTFKAFTDDALLFNMHVYGKYVDADPQRFVKILKIALKGLFITDTIKPNLVQLRCMISNIHFENLLLTGFIYRFSIIAIATMLAFKREYRASALVYLFASALLAIDSITYRAQPFVIVSSYAVAAVITGEFWQKGKKGTITISQRIVSVATCLVIVCMLYRVADARIRHPFLYSYENAFSSLEALSSEINELACGQQNVKLAVYPGSIYPYWFTGMQPVSKYIFMWPWVAEIAMGDVIEELGEKDELAIIIIGKNPVWGKYYPKQYLQPLFEYLEENYLQIVTIKTNLKTSNDIFVSPELAKRCFNM